MEKSKRDEEEQNYSMPKRDGELEIK